jgi:hypothetical protein
MNADNVRLLNNKSDDYSLSYCDGTNVSTIIYPGASAYFLSCEIINSTDDSNNFITNNLVSDDAGVIYNRGIGDCESVQDIYGCIDSLALNYNPDATMDDGSCTYSVDCEGLTAVTIEVGGGLWESEVSWTMGSYSGGAEAVSACLEDGCHPFMMFDSYGDGWNGNTVTITTADGEEILTGTLEDGSEGLLGFGLNTDEDCGDVEIEEEFEIIGCTDEDASNYNPDATIDNEICFDSCSNIVFEWKSSYSGSWSSYNLVWNLYNVNSSIVANGNSEVDGNTIVVDTFCLAEGDYSLILSDDVSSWYENTYSLDIICDSSTYQIANNAIANYQNTNISFSVLNCDTAIIGCNDTNSINYDPQNDYDNNTCVPIVYGCLNSEANNYNIEVNTHDEDLCVYDCDGVYGEIQIDGLTDWDISWELESLEGEVIVSGEDDTEIIEVCFQPGDYMFNAYDQDGDGWQETTYEVALYCSEPITIANNNGEYPNNYYNSSGLSLEASESFTVYNCENVISGCTDIEAFNYNLFANTNDGSCVDVVMGCMDTSFLNYNPNANYDDGSCTNECQSVIFTIEPQAWADIDLAASWDLFDSDGVQIFSGTHVNVGNDYVADTICLAAGEYVYYPQHLSDLITSWNDNYYTISVLCDSNNLIIHSTDGEQINEGDTYLFEVVNCDEIIVECMDSIAVNYNPDANISGDCEYIYGCINQDATNYDESSTASDGSCVFSQPSLLSPYDGDTIDLSINDTLTFNWETLYEGQIPNDWYHILLSTDSTDLGSSPYTSPYDKYGGSVIYKLGATHNDAFISIPYIELYNWFVESGYTINDQLNLYWWVSDHYENDGYSEEGGFYQITYDDDVYEGANQIVFTTTNLLGCTDEYAYNYDETATLDDDSCVLPCSETEIEVAIEVEEGWFGIESSWVIYSSQGLEMLSGGMPYQNDYPICLESGMYFIEAWDSFGDGWEGGTYEIKVLCAGDSIMFANNNGESPNNGFNSTPDPELESTETFTLYNCSEIGCLDLLASNYCDSCMASNDLCEYEVSITQIQSFAEVSTYEGIEVSTTGIVVAVNQEGFFLQENNTDISEWSGVFVNSLNNNVIVGDLVSIEGLVEEQNDMTVITNVTSYVILDSLIEPSYIEMSDLVLGESLEGCLVRFEYLTCIQDNNFYEESILETMTNHLFTSSDFIYDHTIELDSEIQLQGLVIQDNGYYKVCPRDAQDIMSVVSLDEYEDNVQLSIINQVLNVRCSSKEKSTYSLYTILGEQLVSGTFISELKLSIEQYCAAAYIIKVNDNYYRVVKN